MSLADAFVHPYVSVMSARSASKLLFLAFLATPSCAVILSKEHYRPVDRGEIAAGVRTSIPSFQIGLIWFVAGGEPAGHFSVPWNAARLEVAGGEIAWGQHWFGPVLPIFPVIMGAGSTTIEVDVLVAARAGTVTLVPAEFLARATRVEAGTTFDDQLRGPNLCHRTGGGEKRGKERALPLTEPVTLNPGEQIQLTFPLPVRSTQEFELMLPAALGSASRERLPFRYEQNKFLVWGLLPLPFPALTF